LAFDVLRKLKKPVYILSTEKNPVVLARASKLRVHAIQGVNDKVSSLLSLAEGESYELSRLLYIGNDLNDYFAMQSCGFSACPADSHNRIKQISNTVLKSNGGCGVVRELLEDVFKLDFIKILYKE
jgi:N-acylneuraminate cytidylyltransferase